MVPLGPDNGRCIWEGVHLHEGEALVYKEAEGKDKNRR